MNDLKVLVLGVSGMLGHKLFCCLSRQDDLDVYGTCRNLGNLAAILEAEQLNRIYTGVDANNFDTIIRTAALCKPDIVINCIGIIKQLPASQDYLSCININALLPHRIALACKLAGARMIHISTDCIFDGQDGNYTEDSTPNCVDLYGQSKLLGEVDYPHCLTLRTSIIGHELKSKLGLIEWFLAQEDSVQGYTRHIYSGVTTVELAKIIAAYVIPNPQINGIYHISSDPISKYELLKLVALKYKQHISIEPFDNIKCDRSLNSSEFRRLTGYSPAAWPEFIHDMYIDYVNTPYPKNE